MWAVETSIHAEPVWSNAGPGPTTYRTIFAGENLEEVLEHSWTDNGQFLHQSYSGEAERDKVQDNLERTWTEMKNNPGYLMPYAPGPGINDILVQLHDTSWADMYRLEKQGVDVRWVGEIEDLITIAASGTVPLNELLLRQRP